MKNVFKHWFDRLKEPYRFCSFLAIVLPGIVLIGLETPYLRVLGWVYLGFLFYLRFPSWKGVIKQSN